METLIGQWLGFPVFWVHVTGSFVIYIVLSYIQKFLLLNIATICSYILLWLFAYFCSKFIKTLTQSDHTAL